MNRHLAQSDEFMKNYENLQLLVSELDQARLGIEKLKFTYQNDPNIVCQLDIIVLKVTTSIRDISNKLSYFNSFMQIPLSQVSTPTPTPSPTPIAPSDIEPVPANRLFDSTTIRIDKGSRYDL
jgi:hypothetical protein